MNWLFRIALSDSERVNRNILRLTSLRNFVHQLKDYGFVSQSNSFAMLNSVIGDPLVNGRPNILKALQAAFIGPNNQKIVLDSPHKFKIALSDAEMAIDNEIAKEKNKLRDN